MRQRQAEILAELRDVTGITTLRQKDILEWSTGRVDPLCADEIVVALPKLCIYVCYVRPARKATGKGS